MKKSFLMTTICLSLLLWTTERGFSQSPPRDKIPFSTSETVDYVAEKSDPLIGLLKAPSFRGVVMRSNSQLESLRLIDDHVLSLKIKKMDEAACRQVTQAILGSDEGEKPAMKISKVELFKSRFGEACEVEAQELNADPQPRRFRLVTGLYKNEVRAFVANDKNPTAREGESEELRKFYKSLK